MRSGGNESSAPAVYARGDTQSPCRVGFDLQSSSHGVDTVPHCAHKVLWGRGASSEQQLRGLPSIAWQLGGTCVLHA